MKNDTPLDASLTLDEITNRYPETLAAFNRLGMDICCGGDATLAQAAERDGVPLDVVQAALAEALAVPEPRR